jgi:hypothetical protein
MPWRTSKSHRSKGTPWKHTDTEKYDSTTGKKDKSAGKLKVSGEKHEPSMRDIHPPSEKK